jgi:hypothetical protein
MLETTGIFPLDETKPLVKVVNSSDGASNVRETPVPSESDVAIAAGTPETYSIANLASAIIETASTMV